MWQWFPRAACLLATALAVRAADPGAVAAALDAMRLPGRSFAARLTAVAEPRRGRPPASWAFDLYARRSAAAGGATFDVLMHGLEPAADRGKRILFTRAGCWLHDPKARRPVKVPARQLWSQGVVTDLLTWSLARDFTAADGGLEEIVPPGEAAPVRCHRYDFAPRPGAAFACSPLRYWLDAGGMPVQAAFLTAGGRPWRTVRFTGFRQVLGARRPAAFRVASPAEAWRISLGAQRAVTVPAACVDPLTFAAARLP